MFLYSLNDSDIRLNSMFLWGVNCNFLFPFSFCGKSSGLRHREGPAYLLQTLDQVVIWKNFRWKSLKTMFGKVGFKKLPTPDTAPLREISQNYPTFAALFDPPKWVI